MNDVPVAPVRDWSVSEDGRRRTYWERTGTVAKEQDNDTGDLMAFSPEALERQWRLRRCKPFWTPMQNSEAEQQFARLWAKAHQHEYPNVDQKALAERKFRFDGD